MRYVMLFLVLCSNFIVYCADDVPKVGDKLPSPLVKRLTAFNVNTDLEEVVAVRVGDEWKCGRLKGVFESSAAVLINTKHGQIIGLKELKNIPSTNDNE
ncbi:MAG: hypothetical protein WD055_06380 [Candidatus Dependentiae bacterium]